VSLLFLPCIENHRVEVFGWDSAHKGTSVSLSNGNLTAEVATANAGCVRSLTANSTGKRYAEFVIDTISTSTDQGPHISIAADPGAPYAQNQPSPGWFWNLRNSTLSYISVNPPGDYHSHAAAAEGDVCALAWDADAGKLWLGVNNVWLDSGHGGTADPATGAYPCMTSVTGTLYLWAGGIGKTTARFLATSWSYTPPSGFGAW